MFSVQDGWTVVSQHDDMESAVSAATAALRRKIEASEIGAVEIVDREGTVVWREVVPAA